MNRSINFLLSNLRKHVLPTKLFSKKKKKRNKKEMLKDQYKYSVVGYRVQELVLNWLYHFYISFKQIKCYKYL